MIHPTAIIHPKAKLDSTVVVGPYAVIDEGVEIGAHCIIRPNVHITGSTTIGEHNRFHTGCVIGDWPVDLKYKGDATRLRIGDHNVFREHVTVNCANSPKEDTVIGSHNLLTPHCHVGHNTAIGNYNIIGGGAMLAGHVVVQDRVFISGNCLVHQFCRIGTLAMMQGGAAITKDLPPFTVARRINEICGLNTIGLRRAGLNPEERLELKKLYHALFRSRQNLRVAIADAQPNFTGASARAMLEFVTSAKRGVCLDTGARTGSEVESDNS
ncbi:MAG: acyl-ACP--UDP-N-acetylglucosamine O-acyltransferase [Opitutaceae bacterium]|nr:acyl-ACP--UDP-N-acetylglucosamine O-acyltransferase [Verrucomicrobiales bacterium]